MVDTEASKASARKGMRVRVPPRVLEGHSRNSSHLFAKLDPKGLPRQQSGGNR